MIILATVQSSSATDLSGDLIVFHAGSLSLPFKEMAKAFTEVYPKVHVKLEAAGSRDCARKISDLKRDCDVMGSADYLVVETLLMPQHCDWNIRFARNEMSLCYRSESKFAGKINTENWLDILLDPEVTFGRADPDSDPCGYRTVMTLQLAEKHYNRPGIAEKLLAKHNKKYIRPKETDLLALLEVGELDYMFIYRSVAEQHGHERLILHDQINLKNSKYADLYATAKVEISGKKPGETLTMFGTPMEYSVTIPKRAPNPDAARMFVAFLLSQKGQHIIEKNKQTPITPALCEEYDQLPDDIKAHCVKLEE